MSIRFIWKNRFISDNPSTACDWIATQTGLSKLRVKDAMIKGAVWLSQKNGKKRKIRRASTKLRSGDRLELYYDKTILKKIPPSAKHLRDFKRFSTWFKPPGLLSQGTDYGDHFAITRQAEKYFKNLRKVYPVHRLDREAGGIMLIAHEKKAAYRLSKLFKERRVKKYYQAEVLGNLFKLGTEGVIDDQLFGKSALTRYKVVRYSPDTDTSIVILTPETGRLHQIRRHLDQVGYPIMGDPRYGTGNKNTDGMKLCAVRLTFMCPFRNKKLDLRLEENFSASAASFGYCIETQTHFLNNSLFR
jgi:tRNA pseudouridine32 synthase/23S rRNA pseudouridine746 synthase